MPIYNDMMQVKVTLMFVYLKPEMFGILANWYLKHFIDY